VFDGESRMTLLSVPVIDIGPYRKGPAAAKANLVAEVDRACRDIGFLVITGHDVPAALIARVEATSRRFFQLSIEAKLALNRPKDDQVRGYSAVGNEGLSYSLGKKAPGDLKESFTIGPISPPQTPYFIGPAAGPHFAPNLWPATVADFRESWSEYFAAMTELAADLMRMFRVLQYPNQPDAPEPGQLRAGAHSDYGSLTILKIEDRPGGLQVCNKAGEWVNVPVTPNSFVVNLGDLMMQWTNDTWISTLHRVVNPPREQANNSLRQSLVYFHQPNYDAMVECLPSCLAPGEKPKYEAISSGDHLRNKFLKQTTFGGEQSKAA
jgi:isopenicillin N synthase-like dioxygenase